MSFHLCYEETVMQIIIPAAGSGYPVQTKAEYPKTNGTLSFSARYGGDRYDPLQYGEAMPVS